MKNAKPVHNKEEETKNPKTSLLFDGIKKGIGNKSKIAKTKQETTAFLTYGFLRFESVNLDLFISVI
mgnify:CR=1 FL=1